MAWAMMLLLTAWPGASRASTTGTVAGTVSDAQTGTKLSGVNVSLSGPALGERGKLTTVTDANGFYTFTAVPPGSYDVVVSLVGYREATEADLQVTQDITSTVDFKLAQEAKEEAAKQVVAPLVKKNTPQTTQVVTARQEQLTRGQPNNLYQYGGIVFGQPGVTPDPGGYPHFRGSAEDKIGYMIEGIPVTDPNLNLFATSSSTIGLSRLQLSTGALSPEYGGALGGMINHVVKTGGEVRSKRIEQVGGGWGYQGTLMEAGDVSNGFDWYVAGNFWRTRFQDNPLQSAAPRVQDTIAKFIYPVGPNNKVSVVSSHGYSTYETPFTASLTKAADSGYASKTAEPESNDSRYGLDSIALTHSFDARSFANLRIYRLNNRRTLDQVSPITDRWLRNESDQRGLQIDYTRALSQQLTVKAGAARVTSDNPYHLIRGLYKNSVKPSSLPTDLFSEVDTDKLSGYVSSQVKPTEALTLDVGLHFSRMKYDKKVFEDYAVGRVDPRLGAALTLNRRTVLRSNWGTLSQYARSSMVERLFPGDLGYQTRYGDPQRTKMLGLYVQSMELGPERAQAFDLGVERDLGGGLVATATGFRRAEKQIVELEFTHPFFRFDGSPGPGARNNINGGTNHSSGLEFKLETRKPSRSGFSGWLSYTNLNAFGTNDYYGPAKGWAWYATDPSITTPAQLRALMGREYPLSWAQKHTIALVVNKTFGKRLQSSLVLDSGSGFPYGQSGLDLGGDDPQHAPGGVPILVNGKLQPNRPVVGWTGWHHKLSLNTTFQMDRHTTFFLTLDNLLNIKKPTALVWYDPFTQAVIGMHDPTAAYPNGYITYKPYSVVTPLFISVGVTRRF
jgi:Carboxypeptidase regulatory-like domain